MGKPIIQVPGPDGGVNWPGAAVAPETGRLFVPSQSASLPAVPYGNPITYSHEGRQYVLVAVGGGGGAAAAELVALALP